MRKELIVHKNPKSPNSEIFRTLRTNIQFMNTKKKLKTLLVTSTFPAEGKSWVASNLAVTFAQAGKKVVLIDADMRKGRQYRIFEISPKPGLSNYLSEAEVDENGKSSINIASYIQETGVDNLYAITAGNVPPNPSELLVSSQMIALLDDLKNLCDLVIIDGTPCELVTDSIILSRIVDCTVLVAAYKITKKDALERVIKNIQNVGGNLAGVVLNKVNINTKRYGEQYYYYGEHKKKSKSHEFKFNPLSNIKTKTSNEELERNIAKLYQDRKPQSENEDAYQEIAQDIQNEYNVENDTSSENNEKNSYEEKEKSKYNNEQSFENNINSSQQENSAIQEEQNHENNRVQDSNQNDTDFLSRTNEIMKQINDYLNEEKRI